MKYLKITETEGICDHCGENGKLSVFRVTFPDRLPKTVEICDFCALHLKIDI